MIEMTIRFGQKEQPLDLAQSLQRFFGASRGVFDDLNNVLEPALCQLVQLETMTVMLEVYSLWSSCISNSLVYKALTCCHNRAFVSEPGQRDRNLLFITAAHTIGNNIDLVPRA